MIQPKRDDTYKVTDIDAGGNHVSISIIVSEEGSLRILDQSYGVLVDEMYGNGRDVEHWLDLDANAVRKLVTEMTGETAPGTADELAKLLAKTYKGQNLALRSIKETCDENGIEYKEEYWPW